MAKKRQKRKGASSFKSKLERSEKGKKEDVKLNPFDLRINHERHSVLGRKSKHDRGMPGLSRSKAIKKRKEMMLKRQLLANKSNCVIDKRIGEYDHTVPKEEQMIARLTHERQKKYKANIYNLNDDDEELTHLGKPINEFTKFDDALNDSDEDDDDKLDANFVKEAHFGGLLFKKSADQDPPRTHKELINDLIVESKRKKQERKMEREKNEDLTEKLDKEWKEVHSLMSGFKVKEQTKTSKKDPYDMIVNQLKFEPRGAPSSKLKTPEQLAKEENEKLEKLKKERDFRMQDPRDRKCANDRSRSGDYCCCCDGEMFDPLNEVADPSCELIDNSMKTAESDESSDSESESADNYPDFRQNPDSLDDNCEIDEIFLSGKNQQDSCEFSDDSQNDNSMQIAESDVSCDSEEELTDEDHKLLQNDSGLIKSEGLPNTLVCPSNIDELLCLTSSKSAREISEIVAHKIKCSHPSLREGNREKLEMFFKAILEYCDHIFSHQIPNFAEIINLLVPHINLLAHLSPHNNGHIFRNALLEKRTWFKKQKKIALRKRNIPPFDTLVILKLISIIYSTSDFRHPIVTPAMIFMSEILSEKLLVTYHNIASRLYVSGIFYDCVSYSKRFVPEAICYLHFVLFLASVEDGKVLKHSKFVCHDAEKHKNFLVVTPSSVTCEPEKIDITLFSDKFPEVTDSLKINLIHTAVEQLILYAELYSHLPSFPELFSPIYTLCEKLPVGYYPSTLVGSIKKFQSLSKPGTKMRSYLTFLRKKPVLFKWYEPELEVDFKGRKQTAAKKIKLEKDLLKKCKREERGIIREIRRDSQFIAHQKLQHQIKKDAERKKKVNQIYRELAMQEGDFRALAKGKK